MIAEEKDKVEEDDASKHIAVATDEVIAYPLYKVVSIFTDSDAVIAAVNELTANGFNESNIEAFCGWGGAAATAQQYEGTSAGVWEQFVHAARHVGPPRIYLERYEKHLQDGDCIIMVKVEKKGEKEKAAEILHHHTGERVTYFGLLMADEIK